MPARYAPMLATDARQLPGEPGWAFEIKWDGVRAMAELTDGRTILRNRRGALITDRYPELGRLGAAVAPHAAVLDGEIVAIGPDGRPSFQLLQRRMGVTDPLTIARRAPETPVTFVAFDLLELDGEDLTALPYEDRRERLAALGLGSSSGERWMTPRHHLDDGPALLEAAGRQQLEGVVAKRLGSPYRPGVRSRDWIKVRIKQRQDFLIGGSYGGDGGRAGRLGSLLLGVWDVGPEEAEARGEPQRLVYAGGVGSGLSERTIEDLERLLAPLARETNPFELGVGPKRPGPRFCEPRLVCSVEFSEWTYEATLRQPAFKGLRDDIDPATIVREG